MAGGEQGAIMSRDAAADLTNAERTQMEGVRDRSPEAARYRGQAAASAADVQGDPTDKKRVFRRSQFVIGPSTTSEPESVHALRRDRTRQTTESAEANRDVNLTEVYHEFNDYTVDRVNNLLGLANRPAPAGATQRNFLEYILDSPLAQGGDRWLLQACTSWGKDNTGKRVLVVDENKISSLLSTVEGYNYIAADMERTEILTQLGLNMQATALPEQERRSLYRRMRVNFGEPGAIGQIVDAFYYLNWKVPERIWLALHATGVNFDKMPERFDIIQQMQDSTSQEDRDYLYAVYGINIMALDPRTQGLKAESVYNRATRQYSVHTTNVLDQEAALTRAGDAHRRRKMFLDELHVTGTGSVEQFMFQGREHMLRLPTLYNQNLMQEYERAASARENALHRHLTNYERAEVMNQVRMEIMFRTISTFVRDEMNRVAEDTEEGNLKGKIADRTDARLVELKTKRTKEAAERLQAAEGRKTEIAERRKEALTPMEEADRAVAGLESRLITEYNLPLSSDLDGELTTKIGTLDTEITAIETGAGGIGAQDAEIVRLNGLLAAALQTAKDNHLRGIADANRNIPAGARNMPTYPAVDTTDIERAYAKQIAPFEEAKQRLVEKRNAKVQERDGLKGEQKTYREALRKREEAHRKAHTDSSAEISEARDAYAELTGHGITAADLRSQTVEELLARVKGISAITRYPDDAQRRTAILRAKAQDQLNEAERANPPPAPQLHALSEMMRQGGFTENDILNLTPTQIADVLLALRPPFHPWLPADIRTNYRLAYGLMQKRFGMLYRGRFDIEAQDLEAQVEKDKKADTDVEKDLKRENRALQFALALRNSNTREDILDRANDILDARNAGRGRLQEQLSDAAIIQATDTRFSEAERNKQNLSAGYVAWMRLMFPEYEGAHDESDQFDALYAMVPPAELAQIINTEMVLGLPGSPDLPRVMRRLRRDMATRTPAQFHEAYMHLMFLIQQKAAAI